VIVHMSSGGKAKCMVEMRGPDGKIVRGCP
jgi:hypothetical protein